MSTGTCSSPRTSRWRRSSTSLSLSNSAEAVRIEKIDDSSSDPSDLPLFGEILTARGDAEAKTRCAALAEAERLGDFLVEEGTVSPGKVQAALLEQQVLEGAAARRPGSRDRGQHPGAGGQARHPGQPGGRAGHRPGPADPDGLPVRQMRMLVSIAEEVERLTGELRDNALNIRMLPIGTTFNKFKRLVRDLSEELGKEIEMTTEGAETELDKTVIERLNDPLVHLIRNCIDHGIEPPDGASAAGQAPGRARCNSPRVHSGANVAHQRSPTTAPASTRRPSGPRPWRRASSAPDAELTDKESSPDLRPGLLHRGRR